MKLTTKLSMAALIALLSLSSCGGNRAGDVIGQKPCNLQDPTEDCDEDGLLNGEEDFNQNGIIDGDELYPTNPQLKDSDGDGLWDGNEIKVYGTDPMDNDSDDDGVHDGKEVYTCQEQTFDTQYPSLHVANNFHHGDFPDVIDALEPHNDSDGDKWTNISERVHGTNPCNPDEFPPPLPKCEGVYIPGGFDVDGDGVDETGFWITQYPASATSDSIKADYDNLNELVKQNFTLLSGGSFNYTTNSVYHSNPLFVPQFIDQGSTPDDYMKDHYAIDIPLLIDGANIPVCKIDNNSYEPTLLTNKQYTHILKVLDAGGDGETIKNGMIIDGKAAFDPNVTIDYETKIYHFGDLNEFTREVVKLDSFTAPSYWGVTLWDSNDQENVYPLKAYAHINVGFGVSGWTDPYAVIVRNKEQAILTYGVGSGWSTGDEGVVFRVATPYLKN